MIPDAYQWYCDHQRKLGMPPPTREWWDAACQSRSVQPRLSDVQFDHNKEQEGDAQ